MFLRKCVFPTLRKPRRVGHPACSKVGYNIERPSGTTKFPFPEMLPIVPEGNARQTCFTMLFAAAEGGERRKRNTGLMTSGPFTNGSK